jgi:hypothetical protein
MAECAHLNFEASAKIARLEDSGQFMCELTVHCSDCGLPFQFLGLEPGLDLNGARVSIDGLELNAAICPQGSRPNPLQSMAYGIRRFDG